MTSSLLSPVPVAQPFASEDQAICKHLKEIGFSPEVIFDIGGSDGCWTRAMQTVFPDAVYELFEPQAHHNSQYGKYLFPFLEQNPNVRLHTNLVSEEDGETVLNLLGEGGVGASMLGTLDCEKITLPTRTLDSMIRSGELAQPSLIKMDIQGAELVALKGGTELALPAASVLALELWLVRGYGKETPLLGEVNEFLVQHDYYPFDFGGTYREPNGVLIAQDVWYCRLGSDLSELLWNGRLTRPNQT